MRLWVVHNETLHLHEVNENLIPADKPLCGDKSTPSATAMLATEPNMIAGMIPCPFCMMIQGGPGAKDKSDRS